MAKGVKPGDAVFCPAFTFAATAEVVAWLGASPVFVDVLPESYNMDPASLIAAIETARRAKSQSGRRDHGRSVRPASRL